MEPEANDAPEASQVEAPEAAPDLSAGQEVGTAADTSTGQMFTVKVGGEDISVSLDDALNGYMRQADYTQKTQQLATQREDLSHAERIAQALEADPVSAIQALVAAYDLPPTTFQPQAAQAQPASVEPAEPLDPEEARFQRVESYIQQQEMRAFESQVNADLAEMHQQFGAFDDSAVIQYAVENGIPSIREATKAFVVDRVMSSAQRQVAERQAQARKESAPPVAGGHGVAGGTVQAGGTAPVTSVREALALAEASLGATL